MSNQYFGDDRIVHESIDMSKASSHRIYSDSEVPDDIVTRLRKRAGWCWHGIDPDSAYQPYPRPESCERCNELREIADEIERLRAEHCSAFVLKEGELLVVTVPDWMTHLDLNEMVEGLPEDLRKRTVLLRGFEAVRGE